MEDLTTPLTPEELDELDQALLHRLEEGDEPPQGAGVFDVSGLDGFLAAVVASPVMILPSRWLPAVWGDYPPVVESETQFERLVSLMIRQANEVANLLIHDPHGFESLFLEGEDEEGSYLIVDDWCEGFMQGLELVRAHGVSLDKEAEALIFPIRAFTEAADWPGHRLPDVLDTEELQLSIAPNVRALYAHWHQDQAGSGDSVSTVLQHLSPPAAFDDPCPCGSGKKFSKCCLH